MNRLHTRTCVALGSLALLLAAAEPVSAQQGGRRGFGRGFGTVSQAQLASLDQVQSELKLNAEQKSRFSEINRKLDEQRREAFQGANRENFAERREQLDKLNTEATSQVQAALDDAQKKRLRELWVQVNGAAVLDDEEVARELKITDEQKRRIEQTRSDNVRAFRDAFQNAGDLSQEQRRERFAELRREGDKKVLAVLSAEQREQFEKLQGKKVEIDTAPLFQRRRDT